MLHVNSTTLYSLGFPQNTSCSDRGRVAVFLHSFLTSRLSGYRWSKQ